MTQTTAVRNPSRRSARVIERVAIISAYTATILVPTGFAKMAIVPVALTLIATLVGEKVRPLWWAAAGLAVVYAIPFTLYAVNPDRAPSLSKDMDLIWWAIIPVVGIVYIVAYHLGRRRQQRDGGSIAVEGTPA